MRGIIISVLLLFLPIVRAIESASAGAGASVAAWHKANDEAEKAAKEHDYPAALESLFQARNIAEQLDIKRQIFSIVAISALHATQHDTNAAIQVFTDQIQKTADKPVTPETRMFQAAIHSMNATLLIGARRAQEAAAAANAARLTVEGLTVPPFIEMLIDIGGGFTTMAANNDFKDGEKQLRHALTLAENHLSTRSGPLPLKTDRDLEWDLSLFTLTMATDFLAAWDLRRGYASAARKKLEHAAELIDQKAGGHPKSLANILKDLALLQFRVGNNKQAVKHVERLQKLAVAEPDLGVMILRPIWIQINNDQRKGNGAAAARRIAQIYPVYEKQDSTPQTWMKDISLFISDWGKSKWESVSRIQRELLTAVAAEHPSDPKPRALLLSAFSDHAKSIGRVDAAGAFLEELVKTQETTGKPLDAINAVDRLTRFYREQKDAARGLPLSARLIELLQAKYGEDSRVSDALIAHATWLHELKRDEEAAQFEKRASGLKIDVQVSEGPNKVF